MATSSPNPAPDAPPPPFKGKNIVVCCDGTGNEVAGDLSNVLKLFRIVRKDARQRVYYHPGVGTVGEAEDWSPKLQKLKAAFGLATGWGLDDNILEAYRFICSVWEEGDRIFLFGFSRGAYTVRALAGFIHMVGLLRADQVNIADYALTAYKRSGPREEERQIAAIRRAAQNGAADVGRQDPTPAPTGRVKHAQDPFAVVWDFSRTTGARRATIHFMGVWDTVASMIVPRHNGFGFQLRTLPFTARNPSVRAFRHAMAIDERRRMFRLNRWDEGQSFVVNPFSKPKVIEPQDCEQVWFAGVHSDIGGGYAEVESGLSKLPLIWMVDEAAKPEHGLKINRQMYEHLACGIPREGSTHVYVKPDPCGPRHVSLKGAAWKLMEIFPKSTRWREWRHGFAGLYLPLGEPRVVEPSAKLHPSVQQRLDGCPGQAPTPTADRVPGCRYPPYAPENLCPRRWPQPREGAWERIGRVFLGIPLLGIPAAAALVPLWCWWEPALSVLKRLVQFTAVAAGAALLALLVASAIGLIRSAARGEDRDTANARQGPGAP